MRFPQTLVDHIEAALAADDTDAAVQQLNAAGFARETYESLSAHRGLVQARLGNTSKALAAIWQATSYYPLRPEPWAMLGALLNQSGKSSLALWALEKAVRLDPDNAEIEERYVRLLAAKRPQAGQRHFIKRLPELAALTWETQVSLASALHLHRFGTLSADSMVLRAQGYSDRETQLIVQISNGTDLRAKTFPITPDTTGAWRLEVAWPADASAAQVLWSEDHTALAPGTVQRHVEPVLPASGTVRSPRETDPTDRIDIIVPIYRGASETRACLDSIITARCQCKFRLVLVNDASPDDALGRLVRDLAERGIVTLVENPLNLGFTGAVNRALEVCKTNDVLLLNADTVVSDGWLDRLQAAAYSATDIGTVTPLSNNGQLTSYPDMSVAAPLPNAETIRLLDESAAQANRGLRVDIPTGTGFCLFLKRRCLDEIGSLDQARFGRGYGEDIDFCMRALAAGWRNVCATDVYVAHHGTVSFVDEKAALVGRNMARVAERHPDYRTRVDRFMATDPLKTMRNALARTSWPRMARERVLVFGPPRWAMADKLRQYRFQCAARGEKLAWISRDPRQSDGQIILEDDQPGQSTRIRYCCVQDRERLIEDLRQVGITRVDLLQRVPDALRWVLDAIDAPRHLHAMEHGLLIDHVRSRPDRVVCYTKAAQRLVPTALRERVSLAEPGPLDTVTAPSGAQGHNVAVLAGANDVAGYRLLMRLAREISRTNADVALFVFQRSLDDLSLARSGVAFPLGGVGSDTRRELANALGCTQALVIGRGDDLTGWPLDLACQTCANVVAIGAAALQERAGSHPYVTTLPLDADVMDVLHALGKAPAQPC